MSIYIYFENESTWYMSPETPLVRVVTQLWWGHCFADEWQPTLPDSSRQQPSWRVGVAPALQPRGLGGAAVGVRDMLMHARLLSSWDQRL